MVSSGSCAVWRIAGTYLLTSRSSVITTSWQGASEPETNSGGIGWVRLWASFRVRSWGVAQPNMRSKISMLVKRLVTTSTPGCPLTLWKRMGIVPSRCFWTPVSSRSGLTSTSVSRSRPCWRSQPRLAPIDRRTSGSGRGPLILSARGLVTSSAMLYLQVPGRRQGTNIRPTPRVWHSGEGSVKAPECRSPWGCGALVCARLRSILAIDGDVTSSSLNSRFRAPISST